MMMMESLFVLLTETDDEQSIRRYSMAQLSLVEPCRHAHLYEFTLSLQVAPCMQGLLRHSFVSVEIKGICKPMFDYIDIAF